MASIPGYTEKFDMGRVFSRASGAIGRNQTVFLGLALSLTFAPALLLLLLREMSPVFGGLFIFVSLIAGYVMMAAVTHATIVDLRNGQASFGECLGKGFQLVLPLIGLAIIQSIGVGLGFVLLIIPGCILLVMWSVALPVLVAERPGVFASLSRSSELTKGSRWMIFAMLIIAAVVLFIPLMLVPILGGALSDPLAMQRLSVVSVLVQLITALVSMLAYVGLAATYIELRYIKEGSSADSLAAIFD